MTIVTAFVSIIYAAFNFSFVKHMNTNFGFMVHVILFKATAATTSHQSAGVKPPVSP
jgi:hypothetical protein